MSNQLVIRSFDPGKSQDGFAMVTTKVDLIEKKIYLIGGYEWLKDDYNKVENDISKLHRDKPADHYIVEKNNTGVAVIDHLRNEYNIPIYGVYTGTRIKSEKIIKKGQTMDKLDIIRKVKILKKKGIIQIPKQLTPHLKKLMNQLDSFVKKQTATGIKYEAEGSNHDDFVMAFLINIFFITTKYLKFNFKKYMVVKKKFVSEKKRGIESDLPSPSAYSTGMDVYNPEYGDNRSFTIR